MISYRKVGGIRFLRLFRLQFSFCLRKPAKPIMEVPHAPLMIPFLTDLEVPALPFYE